MGKPSRDKGARGEREVAEILRDHGFDAKRDGRLDEDISHDIRGVHLEVKRAETLKIMEWIRQANSYVGRSSRHRREPIVVFRQNNQPWRAVVSFEFLVGLLRMREERHKLEVMWRNGKVPYAPVRKAVDRWIVENETTYNETEGKLGLARGYFKATKDNPGINFDFADRILTGLGIPEEWHSPDLVEHYLNVKLKPTSAD